MANKEYLLSPMGGSIDIKDSVREILEFAVERLMDIEVSAKDMVHGASLVKTAETVIGTGSGTHA